jgi:hypothetical protein
MPSSLPADAEPDPQSFADRPVFDLYEPLTEELTLKIQPSLLAALKSRCEGRHGGKHDLSKHVRRILAEWVSGKADCYDCVFVKLSDQTRE